MARQRHRAVDGRCHHGARNARHRHPRLHRAARGRFFRPDGRQAKDDLSMCRRRRQPFGPAAFACLPVSGLAAARLALLDPARFRLAGLVPDRLFRPGIHRRCRSPAPAKRRAKVTPSPLTAALIFVGLGIAVTGAYAWLVAGAKAALTWGLLRQPIASPIAALLQSLGFAPRLPLLPWTARQPVTW